MGKLKEAHANNDKISAVRFGMLQNKKKESADAALKE